MYGSCLNTVQCTPFNAYCPNIQGSRFCTCHKYTIYNEKREMCEPREGLLQYCTKEEDCSNVPNTRCDTAENTCVCKANYVENAGKCEASIGAECQETSECRVPNSECLEVVNEKRTILGKSTKNTGYCTCKKEYLHVNGECLRKGNFPLLKP